MDKACLRAHAQVSQEMREERVDPDGRHGHLRLIALLHDADAVDDRIRPDAREARLDSGQLGGIDAPKRAVRRDVAILRPGFGVAEVTSPQIKAIAEAPADLMTQHPFRTENENSHRASPGFLKLTPLCRSHSQPSTSGPDVRRIHSGGCTPAASHAARRSPHLARSEPPRVWLEARLFESISIFTGLSRPVGGLVLGRRDVANRLQRTAMVEPVQPFQ